MTMRCFLGSSPFVLRKTTSWLSIRCGVHSFSTSFGSLLLVYGGPPHWLKMSFSSSSLCSFPCFSLEIHSLSRIYRFSFISCGDSCYIYDCVCFEDGLDCFNYRWGLLDRNFYFWDASICSDWLSYPDDSSLCSFSLGWEFSASSRSGWWFPWTCSSWFCFSFPLIIAFSFSPSPFRASFHRCTFLPELIAVYYPRNGILSFIHSIPQFAHKLQGLIA